MSDIGIEAVRARLDAIDPGSTSPGAVPHLGSTATFDPFGATYVAALERRDRAGLSPSQPFLSPAAVGSTTLGGPMLNGTMASGVPGLPGVDDAKIAAAIQGRAAPPGARSPGGYGSLPIPDTLRALGNGKVPKSALVEISQGRHRLYAPAAASWNNLVAAARAEGIELRITDSYRSYAEQVDLAERKGLYSQGGLAATPGTSNHGWGMAVDADVTDARTREWLQVNGPRFGWIEAVPREPWHWEFRPAQV